MSKMLKQIKVAIPELSGTPDECLLKLCRAMLDASEQERHIQAEQIDKQSVVIKSQFQRIERLEVQAAKLQEQNEALREQLAIANGLAGRTADSPKHSE